jgi:hypothetical protein
MCQAHYITVGPHSMELMRQHLRFAIEAEQDIMEQEADNLPMMLRSAERLIDYARALMQLE